MSIQSVLSSLSETSRCNQTDVAQGFIKQNYIKKYTQDVPCAIVLIIAILSSRSIQFGNFPFYTTMQEDLKFVEILQQRLGFKIASFKSKFKASKYNFDMSKFHQICGKKSPNGDLILMKSKKTNCIFGAYTTESWELNEMDERYGLRVVCDAHSFLLIIRYDDSNIIPPTQLPIILDPKNKLETPIISQKERGPMFGSWDLVVGPCYGFSKLKLYQSRQFPDLKNICGGNRIAKFGKNPKWLFFLEEFEVFQLSK